MILKINIFPLKSLFLFVSFTLLASGCVVVSGISDDKSADPEPHVLCEPLKFDQQGGAIICTFRKLVQCNYLAGIKPEQKS